MGELLTADEMAVRLRIKPGTLRTWAKAGMIPAVRITPKVIRYDPEAVRQALAERNPKPQGGCR